MLIMSQNKDGLYNTKRILKVMIDTCDNGFMLWINHYNGVLGVYKTKARAEEVLKAICTCWGAGVTRFDMPEK